MKLSQKVKFVKGLAPAADRWNTSPATDVVKLDDYDKCMFLVHQAGGATGDATLTVQACDSAAAGNPEAVAFNYRKGADGAGAGGDALGAITAAAAAGFDTTAAEDALYLIEIRGDQLPAGKPYVRLLCTEKTNDPVTGAVEILLYDGRFEGDELPSVID